DVSAAQEDGGEDDGGDQQRVQPTRCVGDGGAVQPDDDQHPANATADVIADLLDPLVAQDPHGDGVLAGLVGRCGHGYLSKNPLKIRRSSSPRASRSESSIGASPLAERLIAPTAASSAAYPATTDPVESGAKPPKRSR